MTSPVRILCAVGTRPEAIKMAPVIKELRRIGGVRLRVVGTGQHRELLDETLLEFGITTDIDLKVMSDRQTLSSLTAKLFATLEQVVLAEQPDMIIAQGDTTTVFVASVVAFYMKVPFAHVEAGLRTGSIDNPFPEEFNRIVAGRTAALHFAPTPGARANLLKEGIEPERIFVTGNTVIDALLSVAAQGTPPPVAGRRRRILMTAHRRENFGAPMEQIFLGIRDLIAQRPDVRIEYPVHPNPLVGEPARRLLGGVSQVELTPPLNYRALVDAIKRCDVVLTDSGGLQEEAPALGKPVLVMRTSTERPEAVDAGVARLIGTSRTVLVRELTRLLDDDRAYSAMAVGASPYGDGNAAARIASAVQRFLALRGNAGPLAIPELPAFAVAV